MLYQTWARDADHHFYPDSFADPSGMQAQIRLNYGSAGAGIDQDAGESVAIVAPVGDAFELTGFDPALYNPDQSHPSALGSRLAAMVIYRTIYDEQVGDIAYSAVSNPGISESEWIAAKAWADSVQITPVPLPAGPWLFGSALVGLIDLRSRSQR